MPCDMIVELDFNAKNDQYQVRLIDWQLSENRPNLETNKELTLLDGRNKQTPEQVNSALIIKSYHQTEQQEQQLAYDQPPHTEAIAVWRELVGVAKYLERTQTTVSYDRIQQKLQISDRSLELGLEILGKLGYSFESTQPRVLKINQYQQPTDIPEAEINNFLEILTEEIFQQQYFNKNVEKNSPPRFALG